jgi:hypothetical protein
MSSVKKEDIYLKNLFKRSMEGDLVRPDTDRRIKALIAKKIAFRTKTRRIVSAVTYSPRRVIGPAALCILCAGIVGAFILLFPITFHPHFIVAAASSGTVKNSGKPLEFGYTLKEHDHIETGIHQQCTFQRKDSMALHLFPQSDFVLSSYAPTRTGIRITLLSGSLYIDRPSNLQRTNACIVEISEYSFELLGTRVYFHVNANNTIVVMCYEGTIEITYHAGQEWRYFHTLSSRKKIVIAPDHTFDLYSYETWNEKEKLFHQTIRQYLPLHLDVEDIYLDEVHENRHQQELEDNVIKKEAVEQKKKRETKIPKSPFSVTTIGSPGNQLPDQDNVHFFSFDKDEKALYLIDRNSLFLINGDKIENVLTLSQDEWFKIKPVIGGRYLFCLSTHALYVLDRDSQRILHTISVDTIGVVTDHFYPAYEAGVLIIPIQNGGYYVVDPSLPEPHLETLYSEPFPISPLPAGKTIGIGSFYNNYIGLIDREGSLLWKYIVPGKSLCNAIRSDNGFYLYMYENNISHIIEIDNSGVRVRDYRLPEETISDFVIYEKRCFYISKNGTLYCLDLDTSHVFRMIRLFTHTLATGELRTISPVVDSGKLYCSQDDGTLHIYTIAESIMDHVEVKVAEGQRFFIQPIVHKNIIYMISNTGVVYRIIRNED